MKLKLILIVICVISITNSILAQQELKFTQMKNLGDSKTVYFHIKGLGEDETARQDLVNDLLLDGNIPSARIFTSSSNKTRCQIIMTADLKPEYIREILLSRGYDFDFTTVSRDGVLLESTDPNTFTAMFYSPDKDFPKLNSTGNKEADYEAYKLEKEQWVQNNERKYSKQRSDGTAKYPIEISKADFEKFTEAKKQSILSKPKIYIVK
jgi:hypothetical protein